MTVPMSALSIAMVGPDGRPRDERHHDFHLRVASGPASAAPSQNAISATTICDPATVALTPAPSGRNGTTGSATQRASDDPMRTTPTAAARLFWVEVRAVMEGACEGECVEPPSRWFRPQAALTVPRDLGVDASPSSTVQRVLAGRGSSRSVCAYAVPRDHARSHRQPKSSRYAGLETLHSLSGFFPPTFWGAMVYRRSRHPSSGVMAFPIDGIIDVSRTAVQRCRGDRCGRVARAGGLSGGPPRRRSWRRLPGRRLPARFQRHIGPSC